jgi:hypothetical protein
MSIESPRYSVLKFPAPVCHDCGVPMVTITTIFHHATPSEVKVVSYQCQKCGTTLGEARQRGSRKHVVLQFSDFKDPARARKESFCYEQCRRVCRDWPLVAAVLLALSVLGQRRPMRCQQDGI